MKRKFITLACSYTLLVICETLVIGHWIRYVDI